MQRLFGSKLLFNPVQINGEFFKNTVITNLSTLDLKEQRSELRRPGTMSMRCTEKKIWCKRIYVYVSPSRVRSWQFYCSFSAKPLPRSNNTLH